jgi:hypothetical protein
VAATGHQRVQCSILDEEPDADAVRVASQLALQGERDLLRMDSLEQRHAETLVEPRSDLWRTHHRCRRDDLVQ